jgi:polyisoprenoid-binding protein YceI
LKVTDIEDEESNAKLLGHLKGEDFFAVDQYPLAHLFVTESMMNDTARLLLAELEIKGIAHPAEIRYDIKNNDDIAVITGTHTFDRTMYDIKYKSKSIFGDLGDKFINDEIKLEFNIVLKEAKMN